MAIVASTVGTSSAVFNAKYWIHSPLYDLSFVTGGALVTLAMAAATFQFPQLLPLFFWIWIIAFEGSHFWATWSRTYLDSKYRRENKKVLLGSLVFFLFPALMVAVEQIYATVAATTFYGFFIFVWSLYHNARQHFGFLSIYTQKAGITDGDKNNLTYALYGSIGFAQAYFLLNFKAPLTFGFSAPSGSLFGFKFFVTTLPMVLSWAALLYLLITGVYVLRKYGQPALISLLLIFVCWAFYSIMFYYIAPRDQFVRNLSGGETLMLIAIMNSLFHNIQYHALVYYYGGRRYSPGDTRFGLARFFYRGLRSYVFFGLAMGSLFALVTWQVGDWPNYAGSWQHTVKHSWAYILFFGIIGHHFFLDQFIWRPSQSQELRSYLGTTAP